MKYLLIGSPASGKSTLARKISQNKIPILHLDKIFWVKAGGIKQDIFLHKQLEFMNNHSSWIIDGGFINSLSFKERITRADRIIIFELPKYILYFRFFKRLLRGIFKKRIDMPKERKETLKTFYSTLTYIFHYDNLKAKNIIIDLKFSQKIILINSLKSEKDFINNNK
jgi:adenylate kinase family enzyme